MHKHPFYGVSLILSLPSLLRLQNYHFERHSWKEYGLGMRVQRTQETEIRISWFLGAEPRRRGRMEHLGRSGRVP